jgi:AraC-like DNA-binding protein
MTLAVRTLHRSPTLGVHVVQCRPHDHACGTDESATVHSIAFPVRGTFVKHHSRRRRVVADGCHAIFFRADEPYRVSHPVPGGDECLVVEAAPATLHDVFGADGFGRTHALLEGALVAAPRVLRHRLASGASSGLEADELALGLYAALARPSPLVASRGRQSEIVEATQLALAARPGDAWPLDALARRVHVSPFHLARTFRRRVGMPLHRYLLQARMAAALVEILDTTRALTAIALDLGFSSPSHFSATFRATFGATPASVRRQGRISTAAPLPAA